MGEEEESFSGPRPTKWYSKLVLLLWKNYLLRKRHWVLSLFEILLPTLLFALLVTIKVMPDSVFTPSFVEEDSIFQVGDEQLLRSLFCNSSAGIFLQPNHCFYYSIAEVGDRKFIWGPQNNFTMDLKERFATDLGLLDNEFIYVESLDEMNNFVDSLYLQSNTSISYYVGVFFHLEDETSDSPPKKLNYDLRFQKYWFTDYVFPFLQIPGPRNYTGEMSSLGMYTTGGFCLLQALIDRHFIAIVTGDETFASTNEIQTQMYPYPPYVQDNGVSQFYGAALPSFLVLSLVLLSPSLIKSIVYEKETGVKELVRLMGLEGWLVWLGWFLHSFVMIAIETAIITFFLKVKITPSYSSGLFPPIIIHTDGFILWIFLTLYGVSSIAFCFAISCFFNKPTLATTIGILIWLLSYFIPRGIMYPQYDDLGLAAKLISSLLPNMAMTWGFRVISMFEGRAVGVHWYNLWDTGNSRDDMTPALILIMLTVDILIYFLITWYFDKVLPGKYGVPQPWLFPFKASYWKTGEKQPSPVENNNQASYNISGDAGENFEQNPIGMKPGIIIRNLRKEFPALGGGTKVAVEDMSLTCYEGQCTVLLGHNGAGKTTTMSVITGVYTASGGSAQIMGYDISTSLKEARTYIGLCPQHNTLFSDLTVMEHLMFFAQLKGLSRSESIREAKDLMEKMQLTEKKRQFGDQLSGGMKRKLCLCIAFIGGSQVVILDEPSSGLDPESCRWVWDMVQKERGKRTVLVTTHHMEEADVLGDRIAIMASGKVICSGSTLFLKKRFGNGYSLRVLPGKKCHIPVVTSTVQSIMPNAKLTSTTNEELIYSLPNNTARFPDLLSNLTEKKQFLNINHLGLSLTSMEQVFLIVGETLDPAMQGTSGNNDSEHLSLDDGGLSKSPVEAGEGRGSSVFSKPEDHDTKQLFSSQDTLAPRLTGFALQLERLKVLWMKRIIYTRRKWVLLLTQGLVPVAVTLMCLLVDVAFFGENAFEPTRLLDLSMFEWTSTLVQAAPETQNIANCYEDLFYDSNEVFNSTNVTETLLKTGVDDIFHYRENFATSAVFEQDGNTTVSRMMYQSIPYHAPGIGINLISNALLQCAAEDTEYSITTSNYPLPFDKSYRFEDDSTSGSAFVYAMMMPTALAFLSASYLIFPLQERESKAKQIQLMTGTSAWSMWFTCFTWDLLSYTISILIVFVCFVGINAQGNFRLDGAPGALFLLLLLYGWGSIPMAYVFSFPFNSAASGFAVLALINIVTGMIISIATWALNSSEQHSLLILSNFLGNVTSLIPTYPASVGFKRFIDTGTYNTQCDVVDASLIENTCQIIYELNVTSPFKPCCKECASDPSVECFQPMSYLNWENPGMGVPFMWIFLDGVFYLLLLCVIEMGLLSRIKDLFQKKTKSLWKSSALNTYKVPSDEDVIEETKLAHKLMTDANPDAALVVNDLTKHYNSVGLTAVNKVSFRVDKGECFGLLGVNGAGKTTTFRMLTGDEFPTTGDARIGGTFLSQGKVKFVQEIGYCPQFDAILDELTGDEMLDLLAGLRGVPGNKRGSIIKEFVELVDLTECHKRQTVTYSGGNKRKLSTAMALIGGPPLVFLDEPTTGVDPASRRRVWTAIRTARARGQSIMLTSHSMDECEALCSRIVILVRGQLRCAGTPAHLKAKFSHGYSLQVKLRSGNSQDTFSEADFQIALANLMKIISTKLPGSRLTDQHRGMLDYLVPPNVTWSELFSVMEELKGGGDEDSELDLVEDYSATDPSLEQVFLTFAREADVSTKLDSNTSVEVTVL